MVARTTALTVLALAAAAACARGEAAVSTLDVGQAVPREWTEAAPRDQGLSLVWVFRTDDCLTCQAADYPLRQVQARFGDQVPLVAVHVGAEADSTIPNAFMRTRRLRTAERFTVSPRAFRRAHGDAALPTVVLVKGDTIVWTSTIRAGNAGAGPVELDTVVNHWMRKAPPR